MIGCLIIRSILYQVPDPSPLAPGDSILRSVWAASVALMLVAVLLHGCLYFPRSTLVYDRECKTFTRHMVLGAEEIGPFGHCVNEGCVALLIGTGVVTAASAVVSGSVVVVGNVIYWLERTAPCLKQEP